MQAGGQVSEPSERDMAVLVDSVVDLMLRDDKPAAMKLLRAYIDTALAARGDEERERAARIAEEHQNHIDIGSEQDHIEAPFRCCVAAAIRDGGRDGK